MSVIKPSMEWMLIFPEKEQPSNPETDYGRKEKSPYVISNGLSKGE